MPRSLSRFFQLIDQPKMLGLAIGAAVVAVFTLGVVTHSYRYLNLSGDEIHFYFLGMKDYVGSYTQYYERIDAQLREIDSSGKLEGLPPQTVSNFQVAKLYLELQPSYFSEYQIPRALWGAVSMVVADPAALARSDRDFAYGVGDSILFMFVACYGVVLLFISCIAFRVPIELRAALLLFATLALLRESYLAVDQAWLSQSLPSLAAAFVLGVIPPKDFMIFSFSSRSLFLVILAVFCVLRWMAPKREYDRFDSFYILLPILALVHATHAILVAGLFLVVDLSRVRRERPKRLNLLCYAFAFAVSANGGVGAHPVIYVCLMLCVIGLTIAAALGSPAAKYSPLDPEGVPAASPGRMTMAFRRDAVWLLGFAGAFLLLADPVVRLLDLSANNYGLAVLLGLRLGTIFGTLFLVMAAVVALHAILSVSVRTPWPRRAALAGSSIVALVILISVVDRGIAPLQTRLRSHSVTLFDALDAPVTFSQTNELHLIWYSILRSMVLKKDLTPNFDLSPR